MKTHSRPLVWALAWSACFQPLRVVVGADDTFFPPSTFHERPELDWAIADFFARLLIKLDEPSMWHESRTGSQSFAFRFTWRPHRGRVTSFRLIEDHGAMKLITNQLRGPDEEGYGDHCFLSVKRLDEQERTQIKTRFEHMAFWSRKSLLVSDVIVIHGGVYLFEAVQGACYHSVKRGGLDVDDVVEFGVHLAELSGVDLNTIRRVEEPD